MHRGQSVGQLAKSLQLIGEFARERHRRIRQRESGKENTTDAMLNRIAANFNARCA
jgi:hypothetical protein